MTSRSAVQVLGEFRSLLWHEQRNHHRRAERAGVRAPLNLDVIYRLAAGAAGFSHELHTRIYRQSAGDHDEDLGAAALLVIALGLVL
ncbi:MAG TPA: hypothetical protein VMV92_02310 [Streptosporangiaceae bacterium]|nr:hypothetical protein [Streptosporangiaceae bacterium]